MKRNTLNVDPTLALDGRVRRSERSRQAIVEAMLDLVGSGILRPTAQQVADRAGVGIRSVFRHFSEMDTLYAAMDSRIAGEAARIAAAGDRSGSLTQRVGGLVRQRSALFERVAPYKRAANLSRWRSRFLRERHQRMQRLLRADLLTWLPELAHVSADLLEAVDLATSFEAWDRLRGDRQVSQKTAAAAVERTLRALVADLAPAARRRA
jgi:AcrR family transcriptional regulator